MVFHDVIQGSSEWLDLRLKTLNASEATVIKGVHPTVGRNELIKMKALGTEKEFSDWVIKNLFEEGHRIEAVARGFAEDEFGIELYPSTVTRNIDGLELLASCDGLTMDGATGWECKTLNQALYEAVVVNGQVPESHYWQLEQQALVTGAKRIIFTISDGTKENTHHFFYIPKEERQDELIRSWKQFIYDVDHYEHVVELVPKVGKTMENLPAIDVVISGTVQHSNLADWRTHVVSVIQSHRKELITDQDFADAENRIKWCQDLEIRIKASQDQALSQAHDVNEVLKLFAEVGEEVRQLRLHDQKQVNSQKDQRKANILSDARNSLDGHVLQLNNELQKPFKMPAIAIDLIAAVRGKRTLSTYQEAADNEAARAKIEATRIFELMQANIKILDAIEDQYRVLFRDFQELATEYQSEQLQEVVNGRIATHKQALEDQAKEALEAERQKQAAIDQAAEKTKQEATQEVRQGAGFEIGGLIQEAASTERKLPEYKLPDIDRRPVIIDTSTGEVLSDVPWQAETMTIKRSEYEVLAYKAKELEALYLHGVDEWDGYEKALASLK